MAKKTDQKTLDLIKEVERQKAEISKIERPNWKTNCSFSYVEGNAANLTNIHVESNVKNLVCIAAFLRDRETSYDQTALLLGVDAPKFSWNGSSVSDWLEDIKMRINKIQINSKKQKLELLENRLNAIISPELRAEMELQKIESELS